MKQAARHEPGLSEPASYLAAQGIMGFARLDDALITRWRFGALAEWLPLNEPVCQATAIFFGLELELLALQDETHPYLAIPKIGLNRLQGAAAQSAASGKVSIEVFWQSEQETYLVVVSRLGAPSEIEYELTKQIRARRLAEDNYRLAREQIAEKQHLIDLVVEHAPAAIAMFDRDKRYVFATKQWSENFGLPFEPLAGRAFDDVPPFEGEAAARLDLCLSGLPVATEAGPVRRHDGRTEWARFDHQPWRRGDGSVGGVIAFGEVLTSALAAQRALEGRNAELARVNADLDEFAAIIAHDLSAPVRAIAYSAAAMKAFAPGQSAPADGDGKSSDIQLTAILRATARIEAMLRDLLDYSRIGGRASRSGEVDVERLVAEIAQSLAPGAAAFAISAEGSPLSINAAIAPLDIVLRNLIGNAVKHHDRGAGRIAVSVEERAETYRITVSDDGPGIAPSEHARIFKPFQKSALAQAREGSGIGLALVKRAVEAQGASISVASNPDEARGAAFHILWPKGAPAFGANETDGFP